MKTILAVLLAILSALGVHGQGTILFNNHVPGIVDCRWFGEGQGGDPLSESWGAQLSLLGGEDLFPATTFKSKASGEAGYLKPVLVTVPGHLAGDQVTVTMHVYRISPPPGGAGAGNVDLLVMLGTPEEPGYLTGLPVSIYIPEPSTWMLALVGLGALFLFRRRGHHA